MTWEEYYQTDPFSFFHHLKNVLMWGTPEGEGTGGYYPENQNALAAPYSGTARRENPYRETIPYYGPEYNNALAFAAPGYARQWYLRRPGNVSGWITEHPDGTLSWEPDDLGDLWESPSKKKSDEPKR
jgi:hypothetical protein